MVTVPSDLAALAAARAVAPAPGSTNFVLDSIAKTLSDRAASASQPAYYYIPGATGSFSSANAPAGANLVRLSPYMSDADKQLLSSANAATMAGKSFADPKLQDVVAINRAVQAPSPMVGVPGSFRVQDAPLYDRYPTAGLDTKTLEFAKDYTGGQYLPFMTNQGMSATYQPEKLDPYRTSGVYLDPNAQYRITDRASGKVLYTGTGEEGLKNTFALSQKLSADQGTKANWGVEMYDPNSKSWNLSAEDNPDKSELAQIAGMVLPAAGVLLAGPLGLGALGLSAAGTAAAGAALGSTIGNIVQGKSFGDILKGAALSGLTTYAGGSLLGKLGGALPGATSAGAGSVPAWVTQAANTALVGPTSASAIGAGLLGSAAGPALGSTLGSALGSTAGGALSDIVVTAARNAALQKLLGVGALTGLGGAALSGLGGSAGAAGGTATGSASTANTSASNTSASNTGTSTGTSTGASTGANDIVVTAAPKIGSSLAVPSLVGTAVTPAVASALASDAASMTPTTSASTLDKVIKYMRLAGLGTSLVGDLFGGGGTSGANATMPGGFGGLSDVFSSTAMPAPNLPGTAATAGPRTAADLANQGLSGNQDYYRYGYGPEQSFFKQVPQGARNTSTAYTGYAEGGEVGYGGVPEYHPRRRKVSMHGGLNLNNDGLQTNYSLAVPLGDATLGVDAYGEGIVPDVYTLRGQYDLGDAALRASHMFGGGSEYGISAPLFGGDFDVSAYTPRGFVPEGVRASYRRRFEEGGYAVGGPGDGRDDKIPAMLSDGEYVMDAETVAMLGNGSSKAGAKALDNFRVNIRKDKGRQLVKGNFSVNAKKPEQYLKRKTA